MVVTFGAVQGTRWAGRKTPGTGVQLELLEGPDDSLRSSYKYMFQRLRDVRNGKKNSDLINTCALVKLAEYVLRLIKKGFTVPDSNIWKKF